MKVAFATNDRKTIAEQTGRAKEFVVYELSVSKILNTVYYENSHDHSNHDHSHSHEHGHKEIVEKLVGIDYLYAKHVGSHLKANLDEMGIKYMLTKEDDIMEQVKDFFEVAT